MDNKGSRTWVRQRICPRKGPQSPPPPPPHLTLTELLGGPGPQQRCSLCPFPAWAPLPARPPEVSSLLTSPCPTPSFCLDQWGQSSGVWGGPTLRPALPTLSRLSSPSLRIDLVWQPLPFLTVSALAVGRAASLPLHTLSRACGRGPLSGPEAIVWGKGASLASCRTSICDYLFPVSIGCCVGLLEPWDTEVCAATFSSMR